jgi:hypothetical protein
MSWIPGWDSIAGSYWWENFYFWVSIVALLLLGGAEVISHRYTQRKDVLTAIEQSDTQRRHDEEIARLHWETAELTADAEKSRAAIADSVARAAEANRIAEGERLARVKLEAQLASRHLTDEQKSKLTAALIKLQPKPTTLRFGRLGDKEANEYATEILIAVNNSGISTSVQDFGTQTPPRYGLKITSDLKPAFDTAGIAAEVLPGNQSPPPTTIFVGLKPPPF